MQLNYKLITKKQDLGVFKQHILNLFEICFYRQLSLPIWNWMYMSSINAEPIVSLCFDKTQLVGHYAAIPMSLKSIDRNYKVALSVTTMVHPDYRKYNIFYNQASSVYGRLKTQEYDFVLGFPNAQSASLLKGFFNWKLGLSYAAYLNKQQIINSNDLKRYMSPSSTFAQIDCNNLEFIHWRLSKPEQDYMLRGHSIIKKYQSAYDIVYLSANYANELEEGNYYLLLDESIQDLKQFKAFDYCCGYMPFNDKIEKISLKKDMLLSDVF